MDCGRRFAPSVPGGMCVMPKMGVEYGLAKALPRMARLGPLMRALLGAATVIHYDARDARASASLRASLEEKGRPIGAYDILIAGSALARGLVLVTSNVGEFARVSGLRVENWRASLAAPRR